MYRNMNKIIYRRATKKKIKGQKSPVFVSVFSCQQNYIILLFHVNITSYKNTDQCDYNNIYNI